MQRHRRSSLGGGGVLPFAGHSFLLTAYSDEKQKERICHKITQLGGHVLDDVPKPQVLALLYPDTQPDCTSAVLVCVKHIRSAQDRVLFCCALLQQEHHTSCCSTDRASWDSAGMAAAALYTMLEHIVAYCIWHLVPFPASCRSVRQASC